MKNAFGKTIYGNIGVDLNELAGNIAKDMVASAEPAKRAQREANAKAAKLSDPDIFLIGRRFADGSVKLETVEAIGQLGMISGQGATEAIALANLKFRMVQLLQVKKQEKTLNAASERVSKVQFYIADILGGEKKIQVGAGS